MFVLTGQQTKSGQSLVLEAVVEKDCVARFLLIVGMCPYLTVLAFEKLPSLNASSRTRMVVKAKSTATSSRVVSSRS